MQTDLSLFTLIPPTVLNNIIYNFHKYSNIQTIHSYSITQLFIIRNTKLECRLLEIHNSNSLSTFKHKLNADLNMPLHTTTIESVLAKYIMHD